MYSIEWANSIMACSGYTDQAIEIIIVDNCSEEGDKQKLAIYGNDHPNVIVIYSDRNNGYFSGLNIGLKYSSNNMEYDYAVIGNNDITFRNDFLNELIGFKSTEDVFVLAPNIITDEGRAQNPHVVNQVSWQEKLKVKVYYSNYYIGQLFKLLYAPIKKRLKKKKKNNVCFNEVIKIKRGIGACYILTRPYLEKCKTLDERIFLWGEEVLLSHQVEQSGGITIFNPYLVVYHHESKTVSMIDSKRRYYLVKESYKIYRDLL
jgi:GT2 family glycosyltransferase